MYMRHKHTVVSITTPTGGNRLYSSLIIQIQGDYINHSHSDAGIYQGNNINSIKFKHTSYSTFTGIHLVSLFNTHGIKNTYLLQVIAIQL